MVDYFVKNLLLYYIKQFNSCNSIYFGVKAAALKMPAYSGGKMKNRLLKVFIASAAFLLSIFLGITVLLTPQPVKGKDTEFSAYRAAGYIENIASKPHTVEDREELTKIRNYLKDQLADIGLDVTMKAYDAVDEEGLAREITNVYGVMKGTSGINALLLVAHYDSNPGKGIGEAPGSHGASDDAYGVSVILESLRAVKAMGDLKNNIYVAFTDGEEAGMLGSKAATADKDFEGTSAKAVFNIESRGLRGPAILFETSKNNQALIGFYADRTKEPAAWSIAADVYRLMPNFTDFTSFTDTGMQGLNFSNLDSLNENHTPLDRYENISLLALQGYGNQLLPVIAGFAKEDLPQTFISGSDMTFFTLTNGALIRYPSFINYLLLVLSLLALAAYILVAIKKKLIKAKRLFFAFAAIGFAFAAAAAGEFVAFLLSLIFGVPFKPTNMPQIPFAGGIAIISTAFILIAVFFIFRAFVKKGWRYEELTAGTLIAFFLMQAVFTFALPGGTFLFSWGCLFGALIALAALYLPWAFKPFTGFAAVWVVAPVAVLLHIALSIGSLGAVLLFAIFPIMLFVPVLADNTL